MSALLTPIPLLYRWLAIGMLVLTFGGFCYVKGLDKGEAKLGLMVAHQATQAVALARARDVVTTQVVTKYLPQLTKNQVITETVIKEVPTYALPNDPPLPGRFRVFHDAAAQGLLPDAARIPDAAPVPAQDADRTIAENYGECLADQLRLQGLQEWVTEQRKVKPPE